jgi:putative metallohydrolase (TIGR04338 family)
MSIRFECSRRADDFYRVLRPAGKSPIPLPLEDRPAPFDRPHRRWWKNGKTPVQDSQRKRAYRAEDKALPRLDQKRFKDIGEVARYCRDLISTEWFQRRWPHFERLDLFYRPRKRAASANSREYEAITGGSCYFGAWALGDRPGRKDPARLGGEWLVLHELAHAIAPRGHSHDALWARIYLELVKFKMGREAHDALRSEFKAQRVKFNPPRVLSDEARRAAAENMRRVRAATKGAA